MSPQPPSAPGTPPQAVRSAVSALDLETALDEIAVLLELRGENDFKIAAYRRAARDIAESTWDPVAAVLDGSIRARKGYGDALVEKLTTLVATGRLPWLEELRASLPMALPPLLAIPGLGAKRLGRLHRELGVADASGLRAACLDGRLASLKGFGPASARRLLQGLDYIESQAGRWLLSDALDEARRIISLLSTPTGTDLVLTGALARWAETVTSIDFLLTDSAPSRALTEIAERALTAGLVASAPMPETAGQTAPTLRFHAGRGLPMTIMASRPEDASTRLVLGSSATSHRAALAERAAARGLVLDDRGLSRDGNAIHPANESDFYALLDLPFLPAELREDGESVRLAAAGLHEPPIEHADLRGFLHVHTSASDGRLSLEEMATEIANRGGTYFGVCDHSQASHWAGGLTREEVRAQHAAIDAWNASGRAPRILKGIEADILPDGRLDYDDETLATFDFVVASVHINFQMSEAEMTARVLSALDHPAVDVLGHPTGRLLLERPGYPIDLDAVTRRAAERDVILELNANPHRLDLAWDRARAARNGTLRFAIDTDAHAAEGLDNDRFGVAVARRAGITRREVLNALPLDELEARFRARRASRR